MMIIVSEKECQAVLEHLQILGEKAYLIGFIEMKEDHEHQVLISER